ncbi:MAG TPA: LysE family transporter [Bacteroidales bacterium]|jgi:threonine/homoserine/homoserine lactone efflux protein|nr:LysE family transporter [Bacteroidales bacterium]
MLESIFTISVTGFIAGFIFAMPIAGPISILIVSNALNGKRKYCNQISRGAAVSDFIYIFIAVFGVTSLYSWYKPAIPYMLLVGAVFFIILGYMIFRQPIDIEHFEQKSHMTDGIKDSEIRGFYTGFMVNMLNPTQFISGLISSFFVISLVASLGFNTGGLESSLNNNVKEIGSVNGKNIEAKIPEKFREIEDHGAVHADSEQNYPSSFHVVISVFYALSLSLGSLIWFYLLAYLLSRYRKLINVKILTFLIKAFGISLCLIGLYFGYLGAGDLL